MQRRSILYSLLACLVVLLLTLTPQSSLTQSSTLHPESSSDKVYQAFPNLPKNNEYKRVENGKINSESTLISRLIRYHQDVKKRPTGYRIDWLLTMSDYLGFNEPIKEGQYPGYSTLQINPMKDDIKIIRSLTRFQRRALLDFLVTLYAPVEQMHKDIPSKDDSTKSDIPTKPGLSKPGDAKLLMQ